LYGLLGPSGAGKTTLINILCRLLDADSGSIRLNGQALSRSTVRTIGVTPQENLLYGSLSCVEHLFLFARLHGLPREGLRAHIQACLASVGLQERSHSLAETLSGGMQRRLSLAIAMLHRPQLLILDEPTSGLDVESRHELWGLIDNLRRRGMTILMTTHLLDEAERLCQRIGILRQGRIVAEGPMVELRQCIAAEELLTMDTEKPQAAILRGRELGWVHRFYGGQLSFWLSESHALEEILELFHGIPMKAVAVQPIRLEHIYLELTGHPVHDDTLEPLSAEPSQPFS
jgi:ABC-2 type transport system ATP-binding protein